MPDESIFEEDLKDLSPQAAAIQKARRPKGTREEAIEQGRLLGGDDPDRQARAMAYAAWRYDGTVSSQTQREEFGVGRIQLADWSDWKKLK